MRGFLALGATDFNSGDLDAAEVAWRKALDIDENSVEAHYDLGFLYFNRQPPDMAKVQEHWNRVVELDPNSEIAQTVKAHLDAIASMVPGLAGAGRLTAAAARGSGGSPGADPRPPSGRRRPGARSHDRRGRDRPLRRLPRRRRLVRLAVLPAPRARLHRVHGGRHRRVGPPPELPPRPRLRHRLHARLRRLLGLDRGDRLRPGRQREVPPRCSAARS